VKDAFIVQAVELLDPFATDFEFVTQKSASNTCRRSWIGS
jgi:hypothetical protein